jgi:hypothetical protein
MMLYSRVERYRIIFSFDRWCESTRATDEDEMTMIAE